MTPADAHLKALFAAAEPPPRDPAFSTAVMARVMRQRFVEDVVLLVAACLIGAGVLWAVWPMVLPAIVALSHGLAPAGGVLALAAFAWIVLSGRPGSAFALES